MTRGEQLLKKHLSERGSQAKLVAALNKARPKGFQWVADAPMVSKWAAGKGRPALKWLPLLEDVTGIPMRAWTQELPGRAA